MDKFTPKHFAFLIPAVTIVSLKTYPTVFTRNGGRESWIAMIISSLLILAYFIYMIKIIKKNNSISLYNIYTKALGKTLGTVFLGLFILTLFITLVESASVEANSMHTNMMVESPEWYLLLFFIFPALYVVRKDLVAVIIVTIIGITLITIAGINLSILTARYKQFPAILPIFNNGLTPGFFSCLLQILGLYGSVSITLPYISKIIDKKNNFIKFSVIGLLFVIQMQIISVAGLLMTFELEQLNSFSYPKLLQTQQVSYLRFLEFGELYVMLQILGGWLLKYVITFFAMLIIIRDFGFKRKFFIFLTYGVSIAVFFFSYLVTDNLFVLFRLLNYYSYICLINFIIIPFIVFTIFSFKNKNKSGTSST